MEPEWSSRPLRTRYRIAEDRNELLEYVARFFEECQAHENGRRPEDLGYLSSLLTTPRSSAASSAKLVQEQMFPENATRDVVASLLLERIRNERKRFRIDYRTMELLAQTTIWAMLQIASTLRLREMEAQLRGSAIPEIFRSVEQDIMNSGVLLEGCKFGTPVANQGMKDDELVGMTGAVLFRDEDHCVITGDSHPEACYIFQFLTGYDHQHTSSLKSALTNIYGCDRAEKLWETLIFGVDPLPNMICLAPNMRAAWQAGRFALFPLSREPEQLDNKRWSVKIALYWVEDIKHCICPRMGGAIRDSALKQWRRVESLPRDDPAIRAINYDGNVPIVDGYQFTVTAFRPEDLPSYDLLMFQWDIIRLNALYVVRQEDHDSKSERTMEGDMEDDLDGGQDD